MSRHHVMLGSVLSLAIESAFLNSDTGVHELQIQGMYQQPWNINRLIKIKFEVDTQPPLASCYRRKTIAATVFFLREVFFDQ